MQKNVAGQSVCLFAWDPTTGLPKTGDAANLTAYVNKDWAGLTALADTSATEIDSTNAKGYYLCSLTQGEVNADTLAFTGKSSTSNVVVAAVPAVVFTTPANFNKSAIDSSGRQDLGSLLGTPVTAATPGQMDVNAKRINNVLTNNVAVIAANLGTTQPLNFVGSGSAAGVVSDVEYFGGNLGLFFSGVPTVNAATLGGQAVQIGPGNVPVVALSGSGLDAVLVEAGITPGPGLVNDVGGQLPSINARQAMALAISLLSGVLSGAATTNILVRPAGRPGGSPRANGTVDADGNRSAIILRVPV